MTLLSTCSVGLFFPHSLLKPYRALKSAFFLPVPLMHVCEFLLPLCTVTDSAWPLDVPPPLRITPAPGNARNPTAPHPTSSRNRLFCMSNQTRYSNAARRCHGRMRRTRLPSGSVGKECKALYRYYLSIRKPAVSVLLL